MPLLSSHVSGPCNVSSCTISHIIKTVPLVAPTHHAILQPELSDPPCSPFARSRPGVEFLALILRRGVRDESALFVQRAEDDVVVWARKERHRKPFVAPLDSRRRPGNRRGPADGRSQPVIQFTTCSVEPSELKRHVHDTVEVRAQDATAENGECIAYVANGVPRQGL